MTSSNLLLRHICLTACSSFSKLYVFVCVRVCVYVSCVQLFATLWTVASQAPLSMGFFRQEYWSRLPCPLPGDLPDSGMELVSLMSPSWADRFFTISTTWEAKYIYLAQMFRQTSLPLPLQISSSTLSERLSPGLQASVSTQIKLNSQLVLYAFFSVNSSYDFFSVKLSL